MPEVLPDLTRKTVLAMTYVPGQPIETIVELPQQERDRVMTALVELMFMEMFALRMVQTDPNFANYQYHAETGEIVLLDFGATRKFKAAFANNYRKLAAATMAGDENRVLAYAEKLGYVVNEADEEYRQLVLRMIMTVLEPLSIDEPYDFARSDIAKRMSEMAEDVTNFREYWQAPPTDMVYFHRKLGGMFLLVSRVRARVNVHQLIQRFLDGATLTVKG